MLLFKQFKNNIKMNSLIKSEPLFNSLFHDDLLSEFFAPLSKAKYKIMGPASNIKQTEKEMILDVMLPGLNKEDVKVSVKDSVLTVSCHKESDYSIDNESYLRREFAMSSFSRSFKIPNEVDQNQISSKLENGILTITLPKKNQINNSEKQIDIQ